MDMQKPQILRKPKANDGAGRLHEFFLSGHARTEVRLYKRLVFGGVSFTASVCQCQILIQLPYVISRSTSSESKQAYD
ncbi:hypothetical protein ANRL4_05597 [Anaerolineae bacterium]|nr:hypothetical protein ANRL4_05597 [Anaerolineae bacterium]